MTPSRLLRGVSAGASTFVFMSAAFAQEALPTIDVGADSAARANATVPSRATPGDAIGSPSYAAPNASSAMKTDTPIFVTPASIQVVPRAVIDDRKENSVREALQNVSGVWFEPALGGNAVYNIRGFRTFSIFRNELRAGPGAFVFLALGPLDTSNVESIEVLKGPAAMLYGKGDPGGMISLNTKKPSATPHYSVEQQIGSSALYRTLVDATGPLNDDKTLLYRFTGAFQSYDSTSRDFVSGDGFDFAGAVTWRPFEQTEITYEVEVSKQRFKQESGVIALGNRPIQIPTTRNLQDPNLPYSNFLTLFNGVSVKHKIYENADMSWTFNGRFLARNYKDDDINLVPVDGFAYSSAFDPATGVLHRNVFAQHYHERDWAWNADVIGKFDTFGVGHEVLLGYDFNKVTGEYRTYGGGYVADPDLDVNVWAPWRGVPSWKFTQANLDSWCAQVSGCQPGRLKQQNSGFYAQDHITLFDRLHIIGGGRWDYAVHGYGYSDFFGNPPTTMEQVNVPKYGEHGFSPRAGVLFEATPWLAAFGDWSNSFGVNNGKDANGQPLRPQISEQWEGGLKGKFFDDRLTATLAFYQLTKTNIATADLSTLNTSITGNVRSRGIELDISGRIDDHLSVIGNYAHTRTKILKLSDYSSDLGTYVDVSGRWWPNVPRNSGSIWAKYDWNGYASKEGASFGLGVRYVDIRQGDNQNTFQLPAYAVLDAMVGYKWKYEGTNWNAQLNFKNLTDTRYYQGADQFTNFDPRLSIFPGERFQVIGSLKVEY
ncbi:iron complex outermembrane receptor protein [Methylosinus sp. sav-2]|uniref:TonB-dependent siderophore receptor n=1 Tax=Methylosinus sp. sav-2 TaxID=2485168 RepID=UPI000A01EDAB|nr:TonB-dependent receptor [Methylosinus sp. sav-2]TDX61349.1 iron complex outermembrane receptor protein [Methylosinus sp. sav-2]